MGAVTLSRARDREIASPLVCMLMLVAAAAWPAGGASAQRLQPAGGSYDLGLVFNFKNLPFGLENEGIGAKIAKGPLVFRGSADLLINTDFNPFSIALGAALEWHFLPGPFSPYWGGFLRVGFTRVRTETDPDQWSLSTKLPITVGALLGVEIFVFSFLSLFVEFGLPLELSVDRMKTSVGGSVTQSTRLLYNVNLGLENQSTIGVVLYIARRRR